MDYQLCKHCGKQFPANLTVCPFCGPAYKHLNPKRAYKEKIATIINVTASALIAFSFLLLIVSNLIEPNEILGGGRTIVVSFIVAAVLFFIGKRFFDNDSQVIRGLRILTYGLIMLMALVFLLLCLMVNEI